jgi:TnpA family transposase
MVSLRLKQVTAWQVLKRLSAYTRQHPLYRALKEFGRLVKTNFILRYYDEQPLRQSIEKQLSRIELVNRFSKAVFFGGNQVFGVGTREEQEKTIHARRLIQNAIVLWSYLYLSELLAKMTDQTQIEALLDAIRNGTAIVWHHVNLQGEYDVNQLSADSDSRFD